MNEIFKWILKVGPVQRRRPSLVLYWTSEGAVKERFRVVFLTDGRSASTDRPDCLTSSPKYDGLLFDLWLVSGWCANRRANVNRNILWNNGRYFNKDQSSPSWFTASGVAKTASEDKHTNWDELVLLWWKTDWSVGYFARSQVWGGGWGGLVHRHWGWRRRRRRRLIFSASLHWAAGWAVGYIQYVCVGVRGGGGLHCHTVLNVYAYQATVSASLSRKCLLEFILGEFHMTGDGDLYKLWNRVLCVMIPSVTGCVCVWQCF